MITEPSYDRWGGRPAWTFLVADCLEKVFPEQRPRAARSGAELAGFLGETLSAQVAFLPPSGPDPLRVHALRVAVEGPLAAHVQLSVVRLVPASLVAFADHDEGYLRAGPGLYPDLLAPLASGEPVEASPGCWGAVWIDLLVEDPALAGTHRLPIAVTDAVSGEALHRVELAATIHPVALPPLDIVNTAWLHADCLAEHYGVEVLGEEHWELLDSYLASAAEAQVNSVLTPVWTPPLDTAVGGTRTPVQLVRIVDDGEEYRFDARELDRWLSLCERHGIRTLELAHLFTQWGAQATPAIYVETPSGVQQRFGWHVAATDPAYRRLLEQLLPWLRRYLDRHWSGDYFFHISDEPSADMVESYAAARAVVGDLLDGAVVADALSDLEIVLRGGVDRPIVATDHTRPFLAAGTSPWVYYCVAQSRLVANRFFAMPSLRNRVLGRQLFVAGAPGFLHWGFNFWHSRLSLGPADPFQDASAGGSFPAGDAFLVYPGPQGRPWPSLRHRVFAQAMADHRALQLLRELTDTATARAYVNQGGTLQYDVFSDDPEHYLISRRAVDARILAELARTSGKR